jgi:hypothetical protein
MLLVMRQKASLVARVPTIFMSTGSKEEWMTLMPPGWILADRVRKASIVPRNLEGSISAYLVEFWNCV